jgi:hypothetical protein
MAPNPVRLVQRLNYRCIPALHPGNGILTLVYKELQDFNRLLCMINEVFPLCLHDKVEVSLNGFVTPHTVCVNPSLQHVVLFCTPIIITLTFVLHVISDTIDLGDVRLELAHVPAEIVIHGSLYSSV